VAKILTIAPRIMTIPIIDRRNLLLFSESIRLLKPFFEPEKQYHDN
jgi:hypothetical protein